ncbi:hypothetical protein TNCV_4451811 [Trichonephila clavipes]|nr:hypothetical protein TNCV_4451811 [Trichonephila clavipes]
MVFKATANDRRTSSPAILNLRPACAPPSLSKWPRDGPLMVTKRFVSSNVTAVAKTSYEVFYIIGVANATRLT